MLHLGIFNVATAFEVIPSMIESWDSYRNELDSLLQQLAEKTNVVVNFNNDEVEDTNVQNPFDF